MKSVVNRPVLAATLAIAALLAGCEPVQPIREYEIPKPEAVYEANHRESTPTDDAGKPLPLDDRTLAAYIPHRNTAWFVKLTGPHAAIKPHVEDFRRFVSSVRFTEVEGKEPAWDVPENWERAAGPPPRWATFTIGKTSPPLEVTVSSLPLSAGDTPAYVLQNVNRWRQQLSLRPIPQQRLAHETETLALAEGRAVLVDLAGKLPDTAAMGARSMAGHPPVAPDRSKAGDARTATTMTEPAEVDGMKYAIPAGWRPARNDAFSKLALEAGPADAPVRMTVSALAAQAAELAPNVNRWRAQVQLPPQTPEEVSGSADRVIVGGTPGNYVQLIGPSESIYGAIVVLADRAWFFKLRGPNATAAEQQAKFREFLQTIRFK